MASRATLQDLSAVVPRDHSSCGDPPLCCAAQAVFRLHGLGVVVLVPFSSLSPQYRIFHVTTAPFSTSSHLRWPFPSPVNVYIVSHSVSTCLRHMYGLLPACSPTGIRLHCPFAHSAVQTWSHCAAFYITVLSLGGSDPISLLSRLLLV